MSKIVLYLLYLKSWHNTHKGKAFKGCTPACFNEWCDCELKEMQEHPDWYAYNRFIGKLVQNTKKGE